MFSWTNQDLRGLYKTLDLETEVERGGVDTLGHVIGMDHSRVAKNILETKVEGRKKVGKLRLRWLEDVQNDL
jgi:hypothetical protein